MIEDMENKDILDKVRMKGMNQGIWLAVQELAHDGRRAMDAGRRGTGVFLWIDRG